MENSTISETNGTNSDFEHRRQSSGDELTFSDWHFVDRCADQEGSDDDSIEVIEREILALLPSLTNTDGEESESEEENCTDILNEVNSDNFQALVPLKLCDSRSVHVKKVAGLIDGPNGMTSKVLYSFILGVFASLLIHNFKGCIQGKLYYFPNNDQFSATDSLSIPLTYMNSYAEKYPAWDLTNVPEDENNVVVRMKKYIEKHRNRVNGAFLEQLDIVKHVGQLNDDIYVLNTSKLPGLDIYSLLKVENVIPTCVQNISSQPLPYVCKDSSNVLLFVKESEMISVYNNVKEFFSETKRRLNTLQNKVLGSLTKSIHNEDESFNDNYVHDCDSFSKQYKSNSYCSKMEASCDQVDQSGIVASSKTIIHTLRQNAYLLASRFSWNENSNDQTRSPEDEKDCPGISNKPTRSTKNDEENDSSVGNVTENESPVVEKERSRSGEWLFNLYEARAKLRSYYKNVMDGDWILKLGKAREKLRKGEKDCKKNSKCNDEQKEDQREWYKKAPEKLKRINREVKAYVVEWKQHFKKVKESIMNKMRNIKKKLKIIRK